MRKQKHNAQKPNEGKFFVLLHLRLAKLITTIINKKIMVIWYSSILFYSIFIYLFIIIFHFFFLM